MDNCWISCQVIADMKKVYDEFTIINLYYISTVLRCKQFEWKMVSAIWNLIRIIFHYEAVHNLALSPKLSGFCNSALLQN